jgi:hypothetical protein
MTKCIHCEKEFVNGDHYRIINKKDCVHSDCFYEYYELVMKPNLLRK